ncbi:MAG: hypothetical protein ACYTXE_46220, partial [Nostoc sp.]
KSDLGKKQGTGNGEEGTGKSHVFKHEIEIMTAGGATPAPHCFFRRTLRSKNTLRLRSGEIFF